MRRPQAPATPDETTRGLQPTGHNRGKLVAATQVMALAFLMGAANLPLVSCLRYDEIEVRQPLQEHSAMSTAPQQLHDKATRGEPLSAEEQTHLEQWYARLDDEELTSLTTVSSPDEVEKLRSEVQAALARLAATTQRIQTLAAENEAARREVAALQRFIHPQPTAAQP